MSKIFHCPSCQSIVNYYTAGEIVVRCPVCARAVMVPRELRQPPAAFSLLPASASRFFAPPPASEEPQPPPEPSNPGGPE